DRRRAPSRRARAAGDAPRRSRRDARLPVAAGRPRRRTAVVFYDQIGNGRSTHYEGRNGDFWTVDLFVRELQNLVAPSRSPRGTTCSARRGAGSSGKDREGPDRLPHDERAERVSRDRLDQELAVEGQARRDHRADAADLRPVRRGYARPAAAATRW